MLREAEGEQECVECSLAHGLRIKGYMKRMRCRATICNYVKVKVNAADIEAVARELSFLRGY